MKRTLVREHTFKILFRYDFHDKSEFDSQVEAYFGDEENLSIADLDKAEIVSRVNDCIEHISEIDALISEKCKGWTIERIGKAELSILRLAVYELLFDEMIDKAVAINEAVELSKKFCDEKSHSFVNGVLARIA